MLRFCFVATAIFLESCGVSDFPTVLDQFPQLLKEKKLKMGLDVRSSEVYCIDRRLSWEKKNSAFIVLLPCSNFYAAGRPGLLSLTIAETEISQFDERLISAAIPDHKEKRITLSSASKSFLLIDGQKAKSSKNLELIHWRTVSIYKSFIIISNFYVPDTVYMNRGLAEKRIKSALDRLVFTNPKFEKSQMIKPNGLIFTRPKLRPKEI